MAPLGGSHPRHLRSSAAAMVITLGKSGGARGFVSMLLSPLTVTNRHLPRGSVESSRSRRFPVRTTPGRALVGQLEARHMDDASPGGCSVQLSATTRSSMTKTIKPPPGPTAVSMRMGRQLCSVRAFSSDCIAALLLPEISLNSDFCATLPPKETAVRIIRRAGNFPVARADLGRY